MKIGRNDPCPCGSGKKSKKCCAAVAAVAPAPAAEDVDQAAEPEGASETPPPATKGGGRDWVPLQHQQGRLRPSNFGRKKAR